MLIDSGASCNVIDQQLWEQLKQKEAVCKSQAVQARNQGGCTGCVRTPPQAPKVRILILIIQVKECCGLN